MPRHRLQFEDWPPALYAVGDVHGCLAELLEIERGIVADAAGIAGKKWIVMLGDYVDRGPQSAQVIDHLLQPPPAGFERFCLVGNHEVMMLDFLDDPAEHAYWLDQGGLETLQSYGARPGGRDPTGPGASPHGIPAAHEQFLRELPVSLRLPGWLFVHAGVRPGIAIESQSEEDLVWIREPFLSLPPPGGIRVVHGHTPGPEPVVTPYRICLDTHCFLTGRLTALRLTRKGQPAFITTAPRLSAE